MDFLIIRAISLFVITFFNFVLAAVVWYNSKKEKAKIWLGFLAFFSGLYALFCGATYFFWNYGEFVALFWYKTTWIGILILPCFVIFSYYFTNNTRYLWLKASILYVVAFVILYFVFTTDLFIKYLKLEGFNIASVNGSFDIIGRIYILAGIAISLYNLIQEYIKSTGLKKEQIRYFIFGASLFLVSGSIATSVIPLIIGKSPYYDIVAYFSFIWVALTTYAIFRYKLLDIRVVTTELIVFALWVTLLLKTFSSNGLQEILINISVLVSVILFGIFLIRSVLKEIKQKEEISRMAEDVKRAYVIEKKAKEEIEKIDKFKDQFLMVTQHNLRTPLTSMMGYTDLLLKGFFGKQNKKTTEVLHKFQALTQGMIRMVNNFLDMAQFQLGKGVVALTPGIDVLTLVSEIVGELQFKAESKSVYIKLEKPEKSFTISADREKLKAAIFNIIDNAVKYTEKGGVTITMQDQDNVKIIISDTGIGIPKEKLSTIFEDMFERTEAAKRVTSIGSGVGLYLAGQIIKAHKGKVWVESEGEGKGSVFHIELPIINEKIVPDNSQKPEENK